jgi:hypothetical protein
MVFYMKALFQRKKWLMCLLIPLLVLAASAWALAGDDGPAEIILSWTADAASSQTVSWSLPQEEAGYFQYVSAADYALDGFNSAAQISAAAERLSGGGGNSKWRYSATATGLAPGDYYYRVGGSGAWSAVSAFTLVAADADEYSFLYLGDPQFDSSGDMQSSYAAWGALLSNAYSRDPNLAFGLIGGDLVNDGNDLNQFNALLKHASGIFSCIPLMPANGNHESNFSSGKPELYLKNFALPQNGPEGFEGEMYSFDYGSSHILVLNSHIYSGEQNLSAAQYDAVKDWIYADLSASRALWKIVMFHHPAYPVEADNVSAAVKANWLPLFEQAQVDLLLVGHQHVYARSKPLYQGQEAYSDERALVQVMGVSGSKFYGINNMVLAEKMEVTHTLESVYQVLSVNGESLTVETLNSAGTRVDIFTLSAKNRDSQGIRGDANGDGIVNAADWELILSAVLNAQSSDARMDVNSDGRVDIRDAQEALLIYTAGQ